MSVFENIGSMPPAIFVNYGAVYEKYRPVIEGVLDANTKKIKSKAAELLGVLALAMIVSGCLSYRAWELSRDDLIGKTFNPAVSLYTWPERGLYMRGVGSEKRGFDRAVKENGDTRYYIIYLQSSEGRPICSYSILVSSGGLIKSWRRETSDKQSCYVF